MLKAFRGQQFEHTHENKVFDELYDVLASHCATTQQEWILFGNFHVGNRELDALVIKPNALIAIDFKNFSGKLEISEDGPWAIENTADGQRVQVKGGASINPRIQLKYNRWALAEFMKNISPQCNWGHIAATVLFHGPIEFDTQQIPGHCKPWLHISDMNGIVRTLEAIVSREICITPKDVQYIVKRLGLPPFVPASIVDTRLLEEPGTTFPNDDKPLTASQKQAVEEFSTWLQNPSGVFRLLGMASTGKRFLFPFLPSLISHAGLTPLPLAPSARLAGNYSCPYIQQSSIYTWLYSLSPTEFIENEGRKIAIHGIRGDIDAAKIMPVLVDAHLLSDEEFKLSDRRYGSGRLITDFLEVVGSAPFVVIGDPYQMPRGAQSRSLTSFIPPSSLAGNVKTAELTEQILVSPNSALSALQAHLRESIAKGRFNRLPKFLGDRLEIVEKYSEQRWKPDTDNVIPESVYLCDTHEQVNRINAAVKTRLLHHDDPLLLNKGDRVDFHSRTPVLQDEDQDYGDTNIRWINSGAIGIVDKIVGSIEIEKITLRGRPQPITIRLQKIVCRVAGLGEVNIRYLLDFYESARPELSIDYEVALRVLAHKRAAPILKKYKDLVPADKQSPDYIEAKKKYDRIEHNILQSQGIISAARIRPAFALTVHRAQGEHWPSVWLNASKAATNDTYINQAYFRWLYTATTCADNLLIQNFPEIDPMTNATVSRVKDIRIEPISVKKTLQYDKSRSPSERELSRAYPVGFSDIKLIPLLLDLKERFDDSKWRMTRWQEYPYQVHVTFSSDSDNVEIKMRLNYDKTLSITNVTFPDTQPQEYEIISSLLFKPFIPQSQALAEALACFLSKLSPEGFQLLNAKESNYKIAGSLEKGDDVVEFDLHANKEGMVSSVRLVRATAESILIEVEQALGVEK